MTKHDQKRFWRLALILVAIYGAIFFSVNFVLLQQQKSSLQDRYEDYTLLVKRLNRPQLDQWLKQNRLNVLTDKEMINEITKIDGKKATGFKLENSRLYYYENSHPDYLLNRQKTNFWQKWPEIAAGISLVYWVFASLLLASFVRQRSRFFKHLKILVLNIHRIRHEKLPEPIIFQKEASFYILSQEINKLNGDMRQLRNHLAIQQASFNRLIDHLPLGVMVINQSRQVVLHNQAMSQILDIDIQHYKHSYLDDIRTYGLTKMIEHTFKHEKSQHQEIDLLQGSEKKVIVDTVRLNPIKDKFQVLVILHDVTDARRVEQMQLDFVQNVSHELKTPITAISGFTETLLAGAKDNPQTQQEFLEIIQTETLRLTQLIEEILASSKLEKIENTTTVNVKAVVQDNLELLQQKIAEKKLVIQQDIQKTTTLVTQKTLFNQILKNLISNAIKYNRQNGQIKISATTKQRTLIIKVSDTGVGIDSEQQKRIFERFYRIDRARVATDGGTGLGLAIAQELTKRLNGQLTVTSQLGVGSCFTLKLPLD